MARLFFYRVLALTIFALAFTHTISAQPGYLNGYVITNKGDTIKGKIKDRKYVSSTTSWQKIDFTDNAGNQFGYDPEEIREYRRAGKPKYVTLVIGIEAKKTFMEVQEDGPVILYAINRGTWGGAGNAVVMQTSADGAKEHFEFFLQRKNAPASLMQWRPRDYKNTAQAFFKENEELVKKINDEVLKAKDVREITKMYNEWKATH